MDPSEAASLFGEWRERLTGGLLRSAAAQGEVMVLAAALLSALQDAAPKGRTGAFADSIDYGVSGSGSGTAITYTANNPPLDFILKGTAPHDIYPSAARALYWDGAPNPYAHVSHPGTAANPFALPVAQGVVSTMQGELRNILVSAVNAAVRGE